MRVFIVGSWFENKYLASIASTAGNGLAEGKINFRKKKFLNICISTDGSNRRFKSINISNEELELKDKLDKDK